MSWKAKPSLSQACPGLWRAPGGWGSHNFQTIDTCRVAKLSALRTGRLYPPGNTPGTHLCWRMIRPQSHSATGRIKSMKNHNDPVGNRTRDLPACSAVPQPTAPQRTLHHMCALYIIFAIKCKFSLHLRSQFKSHRSCNIKTSPNYPSTLRLDPTRAKTTLTPQRKSDITIGTNLRFMRT